MTSPITPAAHYSGMTIELLQERVAKLEAEKARLVEALSEIVAKDYYSPDHAMEGFGDMQEIARAALAAVQSSAPALRGSHIKETWAHGAGAYARCSYCGRYSDNPKSLVMDSFPCDCGKTHGWSGSFVPPTAESKWSDASAVQSGEAV